MKEIFDELEDAGDVVDQGVVETELFFIIKKEKYDKIKQDHCEPHWTGYDEISPEKRPKPSRKGFPYRKGRK